MKNPFLDLCASSFFLFLLLCIELWLFFAVGKPTNFLILSYFIALLFDRPFSWIQTGWTMILMMSAALTMGLALWWPLLLLLPTCCSILIIRNHIFNHPLYPALISSLCIATDFLILRPFLLETPLGQAYTIRIIFATLIVTMLFSLKLKTGKRGQSLTLA
ncbi:MAG: hypothetical protein ACD_64C00258G0003 [uncultured bacterium]|nr:MAG: hypothetical protein ACD_64C00258G0003 [uncultured bacterium]